MRPKKNKPTGINVHQRGDYNGYMRLYRRLGEKERRAKKKK
jgi:hypothetical protein